MEIQEETKKPYPIHHSLVDLISDVVRSRVKFVVLYWIENELNPSNVQSFSSCYITCLNKALLDHTSNFFAQERRMIRKAVHRKTKDIIHILLRIFAPANQLNMKLKQQLDAFEFDISEELDCTLENTTAAISINSEPFESLVSYLENLALGKIRCCYVGIFKSEQEILYEVLEKLSEFYDEEMKQYIQQYGIFTRNDLYNVHQSLLGCIVEAARTLLSPSLTIDLPKSAHERLKSLAENMNKIYSTTKTSNELKFKRLQISLKKAISSAYNSYVQRIESALVAYPNGCELTVLEKEHLRISEEQKDALRSAITKNVRANEPLECHIEALMYQINQYWKTAQLINANNLIITKDVKMPEKGDEIGGSATMSRKVVHEKREPKTQLGSLLFKFSHRSITMGTIVNGRFIILQNAQGESKTPFVVGIIASRNWVYGAAASKISKTDGDEFEHWWITDYLGNTNKISSIRGNLPCSSQICLEFILSYLLGALKQQAEKELNRVFDTTIVTIPCWYGSLHRLQVKDAATIAGFSNAYLVNEESAVAYGWAVARQSLPNETEANVLILAQNHCVISAILYCYQIVTKKLTMLDFNVARFIQTDEFDVAKKTSFVKEICKPLLKNLSNISSYDYVFLADPDDNDWLQAFQKALGEDSIAAENPENANTHVLTGLSLINDPATIQDVIRDGVYHDIMMRYKDKNTEKTVIKIAISNDFLKGIHLKPFKKSVRLYENSIWFYQHNILDNTSIHIGELSLKSSDISLSTEEPRAILQVDAEAIVTLFGVEGAKFTWTTKNLNEEDKQAMTALISSLIKSKPNEQNRIASEPTYSNEITKAKEELKEVCKALEHGMASGEFSFKTEISADLFVKKIKKARRTVEVSQNDVDAVLKEIEGLRSMRSKYAK